MTADEERNARVNVDGHAERRRPRQRARRRHLPPRLLDRGRGHVTRATSPRTCSTRARSSRTPTTGRSSSPSASSASARRRPGASTARRSSSATPRPARWTRSTGPTTSSRRSRRPATRCRSGSRSSASRSGWTNIVPVDYVAAAIDHIAHQPGLDGQAFHLVDPKGQNAGDVINTFARGRARAADGDADRQAAHRRAARRACCRCAMKLPALKEIRRTLLADFGIPDTVSSTSA